MKCTHCGEGKKGVSKESLTFSESESIVDLKLCDDCLEEILSEEGAKLVDADCYA